jgi:hypothetical protein
MISAIPPDLWASFAAVLTELLTALVVGVLVEILAVLVVKRYVE